jgi:hypothetical protein
MPERADLAGAVKALRPFVPARDFVVSKRFYADLGFRVEPLGDALAGLRLGPHSFLLQDYYVEQWAANFVMHMLVEDLSAGGRTSPRSTWRRVMASRALGRRNSAYVFDPSGVLWHVAALPSKATPESP